LLLHCSKIGGKKVAPPGAPEEADMKAEVRSSSREAVNLMEEPATACTKCPVCGSEECLMLEELGTYCATMTATSLATREADGKQN
jgi:hypothetical protein